MLLDRDHRLVTKLVDFLLATPCEIEVVADDTLGSWNCQVRIGDKRVNSTSLNLYCGESTWIVSGCVANSKNEAEVFGQRYEFDDDGMILNIALEGGHDSGMPLTAPVDVVATVLLQQLAIHTSTQLYEVDGEITHRFADWPYLMVWDDSLDAEDAFLSWTYREPNQEEIDAVINGWEQCVRFIFLMAQGKIPVLRPRMFSGVNINARDLAERVAFPQLAEECPALVIAAIGVEGWMSWIEGQYNTQRGELDTSFFRREEL